MCCCCYYDCTIMCGFEVCNKCIRCNWIQLLVNISMKERFSHWRREGEHYVWAVSIVQFDWFHPWLQQEAKSDWKVFWFVDYGAEFSAIQSGKYITLSMSLMMIYKCAISTVLISVDKVVLEKNWLKCRMYSGSHKTSGQWPWKADE